MSLNYAIVGCGRAGTVHSRIILSQGHKIIAIVDDQKTARDALLASLSSAFPSSTFSPSHVLQFDCPAQAAADLQRRGLLDCVIVASHTYRHASDTEPFVRGTKPVPVYIEKPLCVSLLESFQFLARVGLSKNIMQIGLQREFDPALCYARHLLLDKKAIGDLREIRCVLRDQFPPPPSYKGSLFEGKCSLINDMAIHLAFEFDMFCPDEYPAVVYAQQLHAKGYPTRHPTGEPVLNESGNTGFVTLATPSGVIGQLAVSRTHSAGYNNSCELIGTRGCISVGRFDGYSTGAKVAVDVYLSRPPHAPTARARDEALSREFVMDEHNQAAEFLARFKTAFEIAHKSFANVVNNLKNKNKHQSDDVAAGAATSFRVTQRDILKAQVLVAASQVSAQNDGAPVRIAAPTARIDEQPMRYLQQYFKCCQRAGLLSKRSRLVAKMSRSKL